MTPTLPRLTPALFVQAFFGCAALGYLTGVVAEFVWANLFVAFGAFLLLALVSMRLHVPKGRVVGVPVSGPVLVQKEAA